MSRSRAAALRRGVLSVVLVTSAVAGYAAAATVSALAAPDVQEATDFGPGDGLTRYVLTADEGVAPADLVQALGSADGVVNAQVVGGDRVLVATSGLAPHHLEALPGVADAEVSPTVPVAAGSVADPYWPQYGWNLENTGSNAYGQATRADADDDVTTGWEVGTGEGVVVAVVDTGYDSDHPDLAGALWTNPAEPCGTTDTDGNGRAGDCHGWNFTTDSADVDNGAGGTHGASVAGAVGARTGNGQGTAGVAPGVTLMPLVIGSGEGVDPVLGAEAIRYAADHGADVVNASWGGAQSGWVLDNLRAAVSYAASKGVVVVAAAGNDSLDRDVTPMYPASLTEPNVITVGASTASDGISDFSAYGAGSVDLFAPGSWVFSTWNDGGYRVINGTSIASPQVAGAVALYRQVLPDATPEQLRQALLEDVDVLPAFAGRSVTGGRLSLSRLPARTTGSVSYTFSSMWGAPGPVTPQVSAAGSPGTGDYGVTIGLGMEHEGEVWALSGAELTVGGNTLATDDTGTARFPLGRADAPADLDLSPTVELAEGRYVLTVQLDRDGAPLGRTYAAPLLVGTTAAPAPPDGTSTPDGGSPDGGVPDGTTPGTPDDGTGGTTPDTGTPDEGTGGATPDAGTPDGGAGGDTPDGGGDTGTPAPDGPPGTEPGGSPSPDVADGSVPDGTTTPPGDGGPDGGTAPGAPADPVTPDVEVPSGTPTPDPADGSDSPTGTPGDSGPGSGPGDGSDGGPGTGPAPEEGGEVTYPGSGPFGITSLSPAVVGDDGGTTVTITGSALPEGARVRVGSSAAAEVLRGTATALDFRAPARVPGVYDVHVFAPDGREEVLSAALTYVAQPAVGPGDDTPGSPVDPGTDGTDGTGGGPGGATGGPEVRTGPDGQRLVRNAAFAALRPVLSTSCAVSCPGRAV
ncbi:S8 family serine peptidase [Geodermatophilus sp. DSM 44513]|uniref:S8 family serine peptidase n=1 Tax=Geodermatophilus sp. DSM 44513 TaxID=1528104 RepID=UPI001276DAD0|nr:S8 family serine peptidase [Geodermatophilus sp. DSM 44513]WNV75372.1 S8 family serine peptidase [Geodermatophilus sp. DSM 44513]